MLRQRVVCTLREIGVNFPFDTYISVVILKLILIHIRLFIFLVAGCTGTGTGGPPKALSFLAGITSGRDKANTGESG